MDGYLKEGEMDGNYISNVDRWIFSYCLMNEIFMFISFKIHYSQTWFRYKSDLRFFTAETGGRKLLKLNTFQAIGNRQNPYFSPHIFPRRNISTIFLGIDIFPPPQ